MSIFPRSWTPVPQSRMTRVPDAERTSTQEELPAYRTVRGPGFAREPLVPQKRTRMIGQPAKKGCGGGRAQGYYSHLLDLRRFPGQHCSLPTRIAIADAAAWEKPPYLLNDYFRKGT